MKPKNFCKNKKAFAKVLFIDFEEKIGVSRFFFGKCQKAMVKMHIDNVLFFYFV
jgi:hypothetical protein